MPILSEEKRAEQVQEVIALIEQGTSENSACKKVGINRNTFRSAVLKTEVVDKYARALELLAHDQAEKLEIAISDMRSGKIDHNMARVEIDARKWFASKFLPKRFGDRQQVEQTGEVVHRYEDMTDEQLEAAIKARQDRTSPAAG